MHDEATSDGHSTSARANGDVKVVPHQMPTWLQHSTPDEFLVSELLIFFLMNLFSVLKVLGLYLGVGNNQEK